jgi:DNA helicase HerA-like ATPase
MSKKKDGKDGILIGYNALNGKPIRLKEDDRGMHMHILGTTGAGKSKAMEFMIRRDIDRGNGLCLIDPHGSLYQAILEYVVLKDMGDRVILINPNDAKWSVGLNHLEYDPNLRSYTSHASVVMNGISKVFGGEDTESKPRLQRWERNSLIPLIKKS